MAVKKTSSAKAKTAKKSKSRVKSRRYDCPNSGPRMSLTAIVRKIMNERRFATFIRDLLCRAVRGDKAAIECLNSYFEPKDGELKALCYTPEMRVAYGTCTEQHRLLDVVAYYSAAGTRIK